MNLRAMLPFIVAVWTWPPAHLAQATEEEPAFVARLIRDMADPLELARLPEQLEYTYHVASSVDPKGGRGLLGTLDHYVSKDEKGQAVLADLRGPGCVRRMFFAGAPQPGAPELLGGPRTISFFFDGEKEPRLKTTLQTLAEDIADWKAITPYPHAPARTLVGQGGGGYFCYLPLAYERSLKIVLDAAGLRRFAYQIGYHTYSALPAGMNSFDRAELSRALADPFVKLVPRVTDPDVTPVTGMRLRTREVPAAPLAPGASVEAVLEGPGIVRELELHWTRADTDAQRGLVLRCYWDGAEQPSVEVPVDDLFGFDHGNKARISLYLLDREDLPGGLRRGRIWLPMPFRASARVCIANEGATDIPAGFSARYVRLRELAGDFGYLHAQWKRSLPRQTQAPSAASEPAAHALLELTQAGRFVGCVLAVNKLRSGRDYLQFGENLAVDGREIPGSAMDHFFNGYDKYRRLFHAAFHAVPVQRGGNLSQFRLFIPDSIPFATDFKLSFPNPDGEDMASVAIWYQRRPHEAFAPMQPAADRARFHRTFRIEGALEAEGLQVERSTRYLSVGTVAMEDLDEAQWSNDKQLLASSNTGGAGTWLALKVPLEQPGRYRVQVYLTKGEGYTDTVLHVNGARCKLADPAGQVHEHFAGQAEQTQPCGPLSLGVHELKAGLNLVKFENVTPGRRTSIGIDCLVLVPEGGAP